MSKIESKKVIVNAQPKDVFTFLSDMQHIEQLLPHDKISDWESDAEACSFKVQNAYTIGLVIQEKIPVTQIIYVSSEKSPFPFTLHAHLNDRGGTTEVLLRCDAHINSFLEIMIKGPLKNLFDYMVEKLSDRYH